MIRFGCFAYSKFEGIGSLLLQNRKFCDKISSQNSFNLVINEINQSLNKLESEIEKKNKFRNHQTEQQFEEMEKMVANFDELQKNHRQFENKFASFASMMNEMEEGNKGMKEAFDKFEGNLQILRKNMQEDPKPGMEEAKASSLTEQIEENANFIVMKSNKWDSGDCGPKLTITEGGLKVEHSGLFRINCTRAALPIPKLNLNGKSIIVYFEVKILKQTLIGLIQLGFCSKQFPLVGKWLGDKDSIGTFDKKEMIINRSIVEFEEGYLAGFNKGDVIGLGIINYAANSPSLKCFATRNGKLLGMFKLPGKFAHVQLYPAVNLFARGDSIKANFGANEWRFNPRQLLK